MLIHVKNIRTFDEYAYKHAHIERVDRLTTLGNPFKMDEEHDRETVIAQYREYLNNERLKNSPLWKRVEKLATIAREKDVVLLCWCAPKACHADIIKRAMEWLNSK